MSDQDLTAIGAMPDFTRGVYSVEVSVDHWCETSFTEGRTFCAEASSVRAFGEMMTISIK